MSESYISENPSHVTITHRYNSKKKEMIRILDKSEYTLIQECPEML